jgi:hypothetical protein
MFNLYWSWSCITPIQQLLQLHGIVRGVVENSCEWWWWGCRRKRLEIYLWSDRSTPAGTELGAYRKWMNGLAVVPTNWQGIIRCVISRCCQFLRLDTVGDMWVNYYVALVVLCWKEKPVYSKKNTTNPIRMGRGSNPRLRGGRPVLNAWVNESHLSFQVGFLEACLERRTVTKAVLPGIWIIRFSQSCGKHQL